MPTLTIFAGVNGCGKTSLFRFKRFFLPKNRINLDEAVASMGGNYESVKDYVTAAEKEMQKMKEFFANKKSFTWETTVLTHGTVKYLSTAKKLGYKINLMYVNVNSVEIALERIRQRVKKGGHNVFKDWVETRFIQQFKNIKEPLLMFDKAMFYDNTQSMKTVGVIEKGKFMFKDKSCDWLTELVNQLENDFDFNLKTDY